MKLATSVSVRVVMTSMQATPSSTLYYHWRRGCQEVVPLLMSPVSEAGHLQCHLSDPQEQRFADLMLAQSRSRHSIAKLGYSEQACALYKTHTLLSVHTA